MEHRSVRNAGSGEFGMGVARALRARSHVYEILHTFFYAEPQAEYLSICMENDLFGAFPGIDVNAAIEQGSGLVLDYLGSADPIHNEDDLADLSWDFTEMFIGPKAPTAPPWASFYLEPQKFLFQHTTLYARRMYRKYGFMAGSHLNEEADDHIALEFEFMGKVSQRIAGVFEEEPKDWPELQRLVDDQIDFISNHVLRYMGGFAEAVGRGARLGFYRGLALMAFGYLEEDLAYMQGLSDTCKQCEKGSEGDEEGCEKW